MSKKEIQVTFNTLTPIWTGDAWGECDKFKLTGLIGSLRWWFEALVRGMGYKACDSTSNNKCQVEIKNPEDIPKIGEKICPVCFLFGATGWKSRISFEIEEDNLSKSYEGQIIFKINGSRGWYFPSGLMGEATLRVRIDEFIFKDGTKLTEIIPSVLKILLYLIQEYGMFGAKTSIGYGVVKFTVDGKDLQMEKRDWKKLKKFLELFKDEKEKENHASPGLPALNDMFFVKFKVNSSIDEIIKKIKESKDIEMKYQDGIIETIIEKWKTQNWIISAPIVRREIRNALRNKFKGEHVLRHFLMGVIQQNSRFKEIDPTKFSAIQVSHMYENNGNLEFRIWGWLPDNNPIKGKVNDILKLLAEIFKNPTWNKLGGDIQKNICWNDTENDNERELRLIDKNIKTLIIGGIK